MEDNTIYTIKSPQQRLSEAIKSENFEAIETMLKSGEAVVLTKETYDKMYQNSIEYRKVIAAFDSIGSELLSEGFLSVEETKIFLEASKLIKALQKGNAISNLMSAGSFIREYGKTAKSLFDKIKKVFLGSAYFDSLAELPSKSPNFRKLTEILMGKISAVHFQDSDKN